jgi:hypothetical protein
VKTHQQIVNELCKVKGAGFKHGSYTFDSMDTLAHYVEQVQSDAAKEASRTKRQRIEDLEERLGELEKRVEEL